VARDHRYRYVANLGTFHVHRWIGAGGRRDDLSDLRAARDLIREALAQNPNAHFGRERYQLLAIEALLSAASMPPLPDGGTPQLVALAPALFLARPDLPLEQQIEGQLGKYEPAKNALTKLGYADALQGLTGLIVLGNAWESVDVFVALIAALLVDGRSTVAYLARLRLEELLQEGRTSLILPGESLEGFPPEPWPLLRDERIRDLERYYVEARKSAKRWHQQREAFMLEKLRRGLHPDTDPTFWNGFHADAPPPLPGAFLGLATPFHRPAEVFRGILGAALCLLLVAAAYRARARRRAASESAHGNGSGDHDENDPPRR
jgi:hypothetical protein